MALPLLLLLLLFLLPVCIAVVRDGHSQELLLLVNVNKMSNVLQSPKAKTEKRNAAKHMIFLSWKAGTLKVAHQKIENVKCK